MSEQCCFSLRCDPGDLKQAMAIHTQKITDSCRDKDCIEDLRIYLTAGSQSILDTCSNARVRSAELPREPQAVLRRLEDPFSREPQAVLRRLEDPFPREPQAVLRRLEDPLGK